MDRGGQTPLNANQVVIDASVALTWVLEDEQSQFTDAVLDHIENTRSIIAVPSLWLLEIGNALLVAERRGRLTPSDVARAFVLLRALPHEVYQLESGQLGSVIALAREHRLSTYDATYLATAIDGGFPLATLDGRLRDAATRAGVKILP